MRSLICSVSLWLDTEKSASEDEDISKEEDGTEKQPVSICMCMNACMEYMCAYACASASASACACACVVRVRVWWCGYKGGVGRGEFT